MEHMIKYQRAKYHERCSVACKWSDEGKRMTQYARNVQVGIAETASKLHVEIIERNDPVYRARVQANTDSPFLCDVEVEINLSTHMAACPCFLYDEIGMTCSHVKALLLALNKTTNWASRRYHINTYKECYSAIVPSMTVAGKLSADETFLPPDWKRPAGRPSKKRKDRSTFRTTSKRECRACGGIGHYARSCNAPSTEYRYTKHKENAVAWCIAAEYKMVSEE
jgi:hypothetical protein